jgi:hypothetical protein
LIKAKQLHKQFLIAKQAREKAQLAVLVKGKTGLFQMFWSNRSFKKAIEVLNSLTADSIDLVPKPNAFNLISIFGSKPNPKVNAILEALLTAIEAITLDSVLQTKYGSSDIQHAFYLLFYSGNLSKRYFWEAEARVLPYGIIIH